MFFRAGGGSFSFKDKRKINEVVHASLMHFDNTFYRYLHVVSGQFDDHYGVSVAANGC